MTSSAASPGDPGDLSPEKAVGRFIAKRHTDATDRTIRSYEDRLKRFVEWCDQQEIERVAQLTAWHIDEYAMSQHQSDYAPTTIKGRLSTLRVLLKYLARIDAVDDNLPDSVDVPNLSADEESSDERLTAQDAKALLSWFRDSRAQYGTPEHAMLEVLWNTGARMGSIRALDLEDYERRDDGGGTLAFRHRPSTGTGLKNALNGERIVGIPEPVCDALDVYLARERSDKRDDHGRRPLFAARQGRPSFSTIRGWSYMATQPCLHSPCPHGRERARCEYVDRGEASKCPSSRSPHRIRTGSITEQLNRGYLVDKVASRCNVGPDVLRKHYDVAGQDEEFEQRRRAEFAAFDITTQSTDDTDE